MKFLRLIFLIVSTITRSVSLSGVTRSVRAFVFAALVAPSMVQAQINEYEVKAAFLFNFALFTQPIATAATAAPAVPPTQSSAEAAAPPYRICIHGKDPFGAAAKSLSSRKVAGRAVALLPGVSLDELKACQMVFIGETERDAVRRAVSALGGLPIITVAEAKEFPFAGVMFNLILVDEKVAFQVNTVAAKNQQLDVSAKLIRLAKNVH
jgi:YfiR/HmsC-like